MAPERSLPSSFHLLSIYFCTIDVCLPTATSRRKNPQHVFPVAFFLSVLLATDLCHRAEVSLKVNPRQELCLPPMLVRIQIKKQNTDFSLLPKTNSSQQTDEPRGCGVAVFPSLSPLIFFPLSVFPVCSCGVLQKGNCPPSLLLSWCSHSPPPILRSPFER